MQRHLSHIQPILCGVVFLCHDVHTHIPVHTPMAIQDVRAVHNPGIYHNNTDGLHMDIRKDKQSKDKRIVRKRKQGSPIRPYFHILFFRIPTDAQTCHSVIHARAAHSISCHPIGKCDNKHEMENMHPHGSYRSHNRSIRHVRQDVSHIPLDRTKHTYTCGRTTGHIENDIERTHTGTGDSRIFQRFRLCHCKYIFILNV